MEVCHSLFHFPPIDPLAYVQQVSAYALWPTLYSATSEYTSHKTSSNENKVNHGEQLMSYSLYVKYADAGYIYIFLKKRSFNLKGSKTWPLLEIVKTIIGTWFSGTLKSFHRTKYLFFIWLSSSRYIILSPRYKNNLGQN